MLEAREIARVCGSPASQYRSRQLVRMRFHVPAIERAGPEAVNDRRVNHGYPRKRIRSEGDAPGFSIDKRCDGCRARLLVEVLNLQLKLKDTVSWVQLVGHRFHPAWVPLEPNGAAWPRTGPWFRIGTTNLIEIFAKELRVLDGVSCLIPLLFELHACSFPHFEDLSKRSNVLFNTFSNANIPTVVLRNMQTKPVRTNHGTHADVTVAQEHSFEISWTRLGPYQGMSTSECICIEFIPIVGFGGFWC